MSSGKRGIPVWGWVALGCGGVIVLVMAVLIGGGLFVAKKASEVIDSMEADPVKTAAELYVRANPQIELVASDDDARTITVRNVKTGEEATLDFSELAEGKFSWDSSAGSGGVTVDPTDGLKIEGPKGQATLGGGSSRPDWIPVPDGLEIKSTFSTETEDALVGGFQFKDSRPIDEVIEYFRESLGEDYELEVTGLEIPDGPRRQVVARTADKSRVLHIMILRHADLSQVHVQYQEKR